MKKLSSANAPDFVAYFNPRLDLNRFLVEDSDGKKGPSAAGEMPVIESSAQQNGGPSSGFTDTSDPFEEALDDASLVFGRASHPIRFYLFVFQSVLLVFEFFYLTLVGLPRPPYSLFDVSLMLSLLVLPMFSSNAFTATLPSIFHLPLSVMPHVVVSFVVLPRL